MMGLMICMHKQDVTLFRCSEYYEDKHRASCSPCFFSAIRPDSQPSPSFVLHNEPVPSGLTEEEWQNILVH